MRRISSKNYEYYFNNDGTITISDWLGDKEVQQAWIPNSINGSSVTQIDGFAFCACDGLKEINIPDTVTNIGTYAFAMCDNLEQVTLPDSLTSIASNALSDCPSLCKIYVSPKNPYYAMIDNVLFDKKAKELIFYPQGLATYEYTIPDGIVSTGEEAFNFVWGLGSVTIPNSVKNICDGAFSCCKDLYHVEMSDSVEKISAYVFLIVR